MLRIEETRTRVEAVRADMHRSRPRREVLHESSYARLLARLESLPVIEQAKGILMAESGCSADEAFDMLRLASQRTNVKVRDIAGQIVERAVERARRDRAEGARPLKTSPRRSSPGSDASQTASGPQTAA